MSAATTTTGANKAKAPAKAAALTIDVYSATGAKKGTVKLPESLFAAPINEGLMHQALVMQQANRRHPIAHVKNRGAIRGTSKKLFQQKGTGRARRGNAKSPLLRGGGKAFGPTKDQNFSKDMPQKMRRAALLSCLSVQANSGNIVALENYPEDVSTKQAQVLLEKMPVELGRNIVIVMPEKHSPLTLSVRNLPRVKTIIVNYLNPEDILNAKYIVFMADALKKAEVIFGDRTEKNSNSPKSTTKPKTNSSASSKK